MKARKLSVRLDIGPDDDDGSDEDDCSDEEE